MVEASSLADPVVVRGIPDELDGSCVPAIRLVEPSFVDVDLSVRSEHATKTFAAASAPQTIQRVVVVMRSVFMAFSEVPGKSVVSTGPGRSVHSAKLVPGAA